MARATRRRPGRFRRWVLRPLFWALAGLAVFLFLLQAFLDTRRAREWGRELIVELIAKRFDREVALRDVEFELLPFSLQVWGLEVGGLEPGDPPLLELPWGAVDVNLMALQHRDVRFDLIRAERPVLRFQYFPDGRHNVVSFRRRSPRPRRFDYYIDRLEVEKAVVIVDQERIELSLAGDAVRARLQGMGEMQMEGQLEASNVDLRLPRARAQQLSVVAEGGFERGRFDLASARISHPQLDAEGSGSCEWVVGSSRERKCRFEVRGTTRGELLGELGYFPDLTGELRFDGSFAWRPFTYGWRSRVSAERLELWERELSGLRGTLATDRYGVRFDLDAASYAGGTLSGEVDYQQREEGQPLTVDLAFDGLALDAVLADQRIPAEGFASRLSGHVRYRFDRREPRRGGGSGEVRLAADRSLRGLPLEGAFPVRIEAGVVRSNSIRAQSPTQSVLAGGFYDLARDRGLYEWEIASASLPRLTPLLPLTEAYRAEALWLPSAGEGTLAGTLYLEPGTAAADVRFQLAKVITRGLATPSASGSLHLSTEAVESLQLNLGDQREALLVSGRIPFDTAADERGMDLVINSSGWPTEAIRPWVPFELPIDGRVSGRLDLHVDAEASRGRLRATARPAHALGLDLEALTTWVDWDAEGIRLEHVALDAAAGELAGSGSIDWPTRSLELDLSSPSLEIGAAPLASYLPRADLAGEASVEVRLRGRIEQPSLGLEVELGELTLGGRPLGDGATRLMLDWDGTHLQARGRLLDKIRLEGGGALDRERAELAFALAASDVGTLAQLFTEQPPEELAGTFEGRLEIAGPIAGGAVPAVTLELAELDLELRGHQLSSLEPVRVRLGAESATIDSLYLGEAATGSDFFITGEVGYEPATPLDLRLQSTLSATWLRLLLPQLQLEGHFDLLGRVGGTLADPYLDGQGRLREGRAMMPESFPHTLESLEGVVLFYPQAVVLDHLRAGLGGGTLSAAGRIALPRAGSEGDYRLQVVGQDLRLRYPEGWALAGDVDLSLVSVEEGLRVGGRADLDEIHYLEDVPVGFAQLLQGFFERQRLEVDEADAQLSSILLNVEIDAPGALEVDNNLARLEGSADLVLRGSLARPVIYGNVDVDPGSRLVYSSTEYEVERGQLRFTDPYSIAPEIDVVATTRVRDFDITLTLSGTLERLEAGFSSEPPLPDHEVFQVLASGGEEALGPSIERRREELGNERSTSAATFLYGQAASVIGERVSDLFGLDQFRIDPLTGSGDNLSTARVTVGKRVSKDVFITYSVDPASTEEQRLQVEWQVSDGFLVVLTQNGDDTYSADARWEKSF